MILPRSSSVGNGLDRSENPAVYATTGFATGRWTHTVRPYGIAAQFSTRAHTRTPSNSSLLTPNETQRRCISSGDRATIRALCDGLGLVTAGLYHESCADGNQWMLDVGPVSSGDAWYIMRKCAELQLIDAGLYKAEYVEG